MRFDTMDSERCKLLALNLRNALEHALRAMEAAGQATDAIAPRVREVGMLVARGEFAAAAMLAWCELVPRMQMASPQAVTAQRSEDDGA